MPAMARRASIRFGIVLGLLSSACASPAADPAAGVAATVRTALRDADVNGTLGLPQLASGQYRIARTLRVRSDRHPPAYTLVELSDLYGVPIARLTMTADGRALGAEAIRFGHALPADARFAADLVRKRGRVPLGTEFIDRPGFLEAEPSRGLPLAAVRTEAGTVYFPPAGGPLVEASSVLGQEVIAAFGRRAEPRGGGRLVPWDLLPAIDHADAGACGFDLSAAKAERVFFLLGFLFEYGGRVGQRRDDAFEVVYCNEREKASGLVRFLEQLGNEQGLPADVRVNTVQECLTMIASASLASRVNACYRPGARRLALALFVRPGARAADDEAAVPAKDLDRRRALAYIAGAWSRYQHDGAILLTAGKEKADLIASLLRSLGCANVRVETSVGFVPGASTVFFEPTPEVRAWLKRSW
jgi:hypothetical protein